MANVTIRPASGSDATAIRELVHAAYEPYLLVMPVVPAPMLADYDEIAASGYVELRRSTEDGYRRVFFEKILDSEQ